MQKNKTKQPPIETIIGFDVGGTKMFGALVNLEGKILEEINLDSHQSSGNDSFEILCNQIQELLEISDKNEQQIKGIVVGLPGITHNELGIVKWAPSLNWRDLPLKEKLQNRFNLPTMIDNDLNLATLGEHQYGLGQGVKNMVFIAIGTGVGAGIIINGSLYRGHTGSAGEIGYLIPNKDALGKKYEGFGALESIVSGTGIANRAQKFLSKKQKNIPYGNISAFDVFQAARLGDDWATEIIDETVDYLSIAVANISTLFDPELIVMGGGVSNSGDLLIKPILNRIEYVIPQIPRLEVSLLGKRAAVLGAAAITNIKNENEIG